MKVKQIEGFQTTDGKIFNNGPDATKHQQGLMREEAKTILSREVRRWVGMTDNDINNLCTYHHYVQTALDDYVHAMADARALQP